MEKIILMDKYPVYTIDIEKNRLKVKSTDEIIDFIKRKIEKDPIAIFIGVFDHYSHTKSINGEITPEIKNAKIILYCFGKAITNPVMLAVRPRNLAVVEYGDKFVISFLEAPQQPANEKIQSWINDLFIK